LIRMKGATKKAIWYGVPIIHSSTEESYGNAGKKTSLDHLAKSIHIRLKNKRYPCKIRTYPKKMERALPISIPSAWYTRSNKFRIAHICMVRLPLPNSKQFTLDLQYTGELIHSDSMTNKSTYVYYSSRVLYYPLFPAGYWKGKVRQLKVTLDLGWFAGCKNSILPAGSRQKGSQLSWNLKQVDLKRTRSLKLTFNCEPQLQFQRISRSNRNKKTTGPLSGRATVKAFGTKSSKQSGNYRPANAIDGNPNTAWCVSKQTKGQPWIELNIPRSQSPCHFEHIAVILGQGSQYSARKISSIKGIWLASPDIPKKRWYVKWTKKNDGQIHYLPKNRTISYLQYPKMFKAFQRFLQKRKATGKPIKWNPPKFKPSKTFRVRFLLNKWPKGTKGERCIREIVVSQNCF